MTPVGAFFAGFILACFGWWLVLGALQRAHMRELSNMRAFDAMLVRKCNHAQAQLEQAEALLAEARRHAARREYTP